MRQLLITTAIIALIGSFARADTQHPTPEEASQLKEYNQALVCAGLAEIIWQLQKDKPTAAPIKDVGIRIANYAIELSKKIWSQDKVAGMKSELTTQKQENVNLMSAVIFSQDSDFIQGVMFIQTTQKALALVAQKVPDDQTRSADETIRLRSQAAQQGFDALNCAQIGK
jgi:hypothetical protein